MEWVISVVRLAVATAKNVRLAKDAIVAAVAAQRTRKGRNAIATRLLHVRLKYESKPGSAPD